MPWILRNPRYLRAAVRLVRSHRKSTKTRKKALEEGVQIPPFLIMSITSHCNLSCAGCYAAAVGTLRKGSPSPCSTNTTQMEWDHWHCLIEEASELGVFSFIIAGGEPFLFPGLIDLCLEFPDRFFIILTNGTVFREEDYEKLRKSTNIAVIVSVEGGPEMTDQRRGSGVHEKAVSTLERMKSIGIPAGISTTINKRNFRYWMSPEHLNEFVSKGALVGVFIEYIPVGENDDRTLMLTSEERQEFRTRILEYREKKPIYVVHSPGDEEYFGGCVSAGRGFAHITPHGDLTACPVSNLATHNMTSSTLREGLSSRLFEEIRANEHLLENEDTPCALFGHPEEVREIAEAVGAYQTDSYRL